MTISQKNGKNGNGKHPGGRPTIYTKELAEEICGLTASHSVGYQRLEKLYPHLPNVQTLYNWFRKYPELIEMYLKAKEIQAHLLLDNTIDISNRDEYEKEINENDNLIKINRDKLKIDTYKFAATRLNPRTYGDKRETTNNVNISEIKQKIRDADSEYKY
jgi:hypothetical protein